MLQVYNCITQQHDLRLVIVAGFICFLAAYTAFSLVGRAVEAGAQGARLVDRRRAPSPPAAASGRRISSP